MIHSAILLAAGRGNRLRPYTDVTPKPLLPVRGRPTLDYILVAARRAGIGRVCLVTHYLERQIQEYVGNGSKWNLQAEYVHQKQIRGSGNALASVPRDWSQGKPVLVLASDYILAENTLLELVQAHEQHKADITMSLKECPLTELIHRSSVEVDASWRVRRIVEKPGFDQILSPYAASVLFVFPSDLWEYLPRIRPSERGEIELQAAVQMMINDGYQAYGLLQPAPEEWNPADHLATEP